MENIHSNNDIYELSMLADKIQTSDDFKKFLLEVKKRYDNVRGKRESQHWNNQDIGTFSDGLAAGLIHSSLYKKNLLNWSDLAYIIIIGIDYE